MELEDSLPGRAFAFTTKILVGSLRSVWAFCSVVMMTVLPPCVGPTTIVVCRVSIVSYSCTTCGGGGGHEGRAGAGLGGTRSAAMPTLANPRLWHAPAWLHAGRSAALSCRFWIAGGNWPGPITGVRSRTYTTELPEPCGLHCGPQTVLPNVSITHCQRLSSTYVIQSRTPQEVGFSQNGMYREESQLPVR